MHTSVAVTFSPEIPIILYNCRILQIVTIPLLSTKTSLTPPPKKPKKIASRYPRDAIFSSV